MHANDERENRVYLSGPQGSKDVKRIKTNIMTGYVVTFGLKPEVGE